jgi:hypothetical protein
VTWLTWRQHRVETLALALLVVALGVAMAVLARPLHALFPAGAADCAVPPLDYGCRVGFAQLEKLHAYALPMLILFNFVPFVIGAFLGAPLLARELEQGTWQLAWTQAVPRLRWLAIKLAAFAALVGWYREPFDLYGGFGIDAFDVTGIVPCAYGLFAFALAAVAGALLRRSLPALGVALVVFAATRVTVAGWLRPHFRAPVALVETIPPGTGEVTTGTSDLRDGIIGQGVMDPDGRRLGDLAAAIVQHKAMDTGADPTTYLHNAGYHRWVDYQPVGRFWAFQLIESGIFVGLAALLLAVLVWRVRRRPF